MFNNVDSTQLVAIDDIITNIFKCNISIITLAHFIIEQCDVNGDWWLVIHTGFSIITNESV